MLRMQRRRMPHLTTVLALVAGVVAWLPLVVASQAPVTAEVTPVLDQRAEIQIGSDIASDGQTGPLEQSAPYFNPLCDTDTGLWAQTITAGMTGHLVAVDLLLLRRSPDITSPVGMEIRAVDDVGFPTGTLLGRGLTVDVIPPHRSTASWLTVPLDTPVLLRVGQKVALLPTSTPSPTGACYEWISGGLDRYWGGAIAVTHDLGTTFAIESGNDAAVRTWMR